MRVHFSWLTILLRAEREGVLGGANCNNGWLMNRILGIRTQTGKLLQSLGDGLHHKGIHSEAVGIE
jgi:hypothetical protein